VCVRCGEALVVVAAVHLARRYCGVPCRRAVEYEVRRVRRRLADREAEHARRVRLDAWNNGLLRSLRSFGGRSWQDDLNDIQSEVAALRRRLHTLRHPRAAASGRKEIVR